ncbi:MAG: methyl-accepting chemotaxis protein [Candidatus Eremiobacteraeota bacterium]|nr:methyl-accepting chemotaxis protein [Candidatus Eremiobacteraeota bacterium]
MNGLSRFPVPVQIGAGFFIGVVLLGIVTAVGIGRIAVMRARANEAAALGAISTLTRDVMAQMLDQSAAVRGYVATGQRRYLDSLNAAQIALSGDLSTLDKSDQTNAIDSARLEQVDIEAAQIETDVDAVKKGFDRQIAVGARRPRDVDAAMAATDLSFKSLRRDNDALASYSTEQAKVAEAQFERAQVVLVTTLLASTVAAAFALVLTAVFIGGSIARRLQSVTRALLDVTEHDVAMLTTAFDRLSAGDLSATFESDRSFIADEGSDEIAQLANSYNGVAAGLGLISMEFNKMAKTLRGVMSGIASATVDLAQLDSRMSAAAGSASVAVDRIAASMEGVADGAHSQAERIAVAHGEINALASSAHQIAAASDEQGRGALGAVDSVRQLDEQISALAIMGTTLADAAGHARVEAQSGERSVEQTAGAMERIKEATGVAHSAMKNLETSSSAVSEIVAVIHDIADQTNLLALNAAIEAARAGDQGRGFAVVADEVRKLAEKSRVSTGEIGRILDAIREESVRAAAAISSASEQVESGMVLSAHATGALGALGAAIAQTSDVAAEVANRSDEMKRASGALTQNIGAVSRIVGENAAAAGHVSERSALVRSTIDPVAESADAQAKSAREVSDATGVLSQQISEMNRASQSSHAKSEQLRELVAVFYNVDVPAIVKSIARIAAIALLAAGVLHPRPASATQEFARRTLLSCGTCHVTPAKLTDFGKAFKARGYAVPRLVGRGDLPATLQAQSAYFSDPDPTGLPKYIVDKVIGLVGGPIGPHFTYDGQQYFIDGGRPGDLREAWLEYTSSWTDKIPIDVRAGQQVLILPTDPQRFKLSEQDYAVFVQAVGNNPFNLYEPMDGIRVSLGKEVSGLNASVLALSNHDQGSPIGQTGTDWMFVGRETVKNADFEVYRYTGRRALGPDDQFWRQGYGANAYHGRFTLRAMWQTGNDTNPLGTGRAMQSSGGYVEGVYQLGGSVFAYAREDGVNTSAGGFGRDFVYGTSIFLGRPFKLQIEDVLTTQGQTHNALAVIFGIGASTIHTGANSY